MYLEPAPRCQNETMKQVIGSGLLQSAQLVACNVENQCCNCPNVELEDCKGFCLKNKKCVSIQYNPFSKDCKLWDQAPSKSGQAPPSGDESYVKSCGNSNEYQTILNKHNLLFSIL